MTIESDFWTTKCHYSDIEHAQNMDVSFERLRPSSIYKPKIFIDGNKWCALYGEDIQCGVAGFGDSPDLAYADFDKNWVKKL
jgi:hypothetical protein